MAFPLWIHWSHINKRYKFQDDQQTTRWKGTTNSHLGLLDFSAYVRPGITVILGSEGSGKSTLLKLTATVMLPDDGRVTFHVNTEEHYTWSKSSMIASSTASLGELKNKIGYVPEIKRLRHDSICEDALLHLAQLRRLSKPRVHVAALIAQWGLAGYRKLELHNLPTSAMKRYLIAQSLLVDPDFWILDEPTLGLDPLGRRLLIEELRNQHRERIILLSTQDMELAELANEIILLDYGACRRIGNRRMLTASVSEGTVAAWYETMQTFSQVRSQFR